MIGSQGVFRKLFVVSCVFALSLGSVAALAKTGTGTVDRHVVESNWAKQCIAPKTGSVKTCEIVKQLFVKETKARVAEFAIGYPTGQKIARGVVSLPLGILLSNGVSMKIDDGKVYSFKVHHCIDAGCISYVDLNDAILNDLKNGKNIDFLFKSAEGQQIKIVLSLSGFSKALAAL